MTRQQARRRATVAAMLTMGVAAYVSFPFLEGLLQDGVGALDLVAGSALVAPALGACAGMVAPSARSATRRTLLVGALAGALVPVVHLVLGQGWVIAPFLAAVYGALLTLPTRALVGITLEVREAPTVDGVDRVVAACGAFLVAVKAPETYLAVRAFEEKVAVATAATALLGAALVIAMNTRRRRRVRRWASADPDLTAPIAELASTEAAERAPELPGEDPVAVLEAREGSGSYRSGEERRVVAVVPRVPAPLDPVSDLRRAGRSLAMAAAIALVGSWALRLSLSF